MAYGTKHQTVNGVKLMGSNLFGTCSSSGSSSTKNVTLDGFDVLVTGVTIHVKFTYYNYSACNLVVGSTGAASVRRNGSSYPYWESGAVISFTYDGQYWQQNDFYDTTGGYDGNTTYTLSKSGHTIYLTPSSGTGSSVTESSPTRNSHTFSISSLAKDGGHTTLTYYVGTSCLGVVGYNVETTSGQGHMINVWECRYYDGYLRVQVTNLSSSSAFKGSIIVDYLTW